MSGLLQDVRHAVRLVRLEPGTILAVVVLIALGIAATTTMFSVTYGVLVRPLPHRGVVH